MDARTAAIVAACLLLINCAAMSATGSGGVAAAGAGCSLSSIVVTQAATGEWAHGQPVYAVTVRNTCACAQSGVRLACDGFDTTFAVDPAKLSRPVGGGPCLVNGGAPVVRGRDLTFKYAWSRQFPFRPVSSTVAC